ncbi:major histocompatibility complex class I UXA2 precursor [Silurus meridionalis]|nr:major histocompatibility complex class I UXA2 precursor [Silurus meridionalis]
MMKTLLILTSFLLSTLADTHTLHYFYTVVTAQLNSSISSKTQFTAVGLLDGEQFLSYSSSSVKLSVKDWMKKTEAETYWRSEAQDMQSNQDNFNSIMSTVMTSFNHNGDTHTLHYFYTVVTAQLNSSISSKTQFTAVGLLDGEQFLSYSSSSVKLSVKDWMKKTEAETYWRRGLYTVQYMHGCELDDDGTTRAYYQDAYNGEDLISLDLNSENWITTKPQAEIIKNKWEATGHGAKYCKNYLQHECVETLRNFLSHSREILERKVHPETSLFWKHSSPPEVVCDATGFFPKALLISWQKDGEDVYEDVELRETLPNQDGSFQKRSILKVSAEELQKHTYTCEIEHSSLENSAADLVLPVSERRILRDGGSGGGSDGGSDGGKGSTGTHTLQYFYTAVTPGINFPEISAVGLVDGEKIVYFDSNIRKMIPKTEWIQKVKDDDPDYWSRETQKMMYHQEELKMFLFTFMYRFNHSDGVHTLQWMYGCELGDDNTIRGYDHYGYDNEDLLALDLKTLTWIAVSPPAVISKHQWDATGDEAKNRKKYLEVECINWLKKFVSYGREILKRKVTHSVQYLYTMLKPQLTFSEFNAVGLLDGEQFMSYNSTTRMLIAEDWIKKIEREELWKSLKQDIQGHQDGLNKIIKTLLKVFVNITDVHTLQRMYGCEVDDGNTSGYDRYGYNGEDLMSLELKTATWIAANDKAELVRKMWDPDGSQAKGWKTFLENDCSEQLKRYMSYGKESVERKVPPTMSMFKTPSSSSEVVCHATGFFPRALNISWLKDGQNVYKDLGKTLPNLDGSFQKRSILEVSTEELQKHNYTCVIEHSSLEKDLVLVPVSECRTLKEKHSLQYLYIAVQKGNNSPNISQTVFSAAVLLDGEQVMSYNSSERILIPKAWIKETETEDFWRSETQEMQGYHDEFTKKFHMVLKLFPFHTGVHTLQRMYGCEDENNSIVRRYDEYGYDGQDIVSLNLDSKSWSAANGSKTIKGIWKTKEAQFWMSQLETVCTDWFGKFYSKQRKFGPKASLFQKHSSSPEVVCHATGFFPKTMNITWQKDGEDVHENVELSETLPNEDGSFQKRSILKVSAEELQEHTYTCVIEHSSLEKEMVLEVPKDGGSGRERVGIFVGVIVAFVVLVAALVVGKEKELCGYNQYGYIGEDFIILDLKTPTWIAVKPQAEILKHNWESTGYTKYWKNFLENKCIDLLNRFVNYGRKTVERKGCADNELPSSGSQQSEGIMAAICKATVNYTLKKSTLIVNEWFLVAFDV